MNKKIMYFILIVFMIVIGIIIYFIYRNHKNSLKNNQQKLHNQNHKKYLEMRKMNQINNYKRKMNSLMRSAYLRAEKQVDKENIEDTVIGNGYFLPDSNVLNLNFPKLENKIFKEYIYVYSNIDSQSGEKSVKTISNDNTLIQRLDLNSIDSNYGFKNDLDSIIDGIGIKINNGNVKKPTQVVNINKTLKYMLDTNIDSDTLLQDYNEKYFGYNYEFTKKTFCIYMLNDLLSNENNISNEFLDELVNLVYTKPIILKKDDINNNDIYSYVQRDVNSKEKFQPNNVHVDENDFTPYIEFMKKWGSHFINGVTFGKSFSIWEIFSRNLLQDYKIDYQKRIDLCKKECLKSTTPEECISNLKETFEYYESTPTPYPGYYTPTPTPAPHYLNFKINDILKGLTKELIDNPNLDPMKLNKDIDTYPEDCKLGEWSKWSECNVKCGGGTQNRTRNIIEEPKYGGNECPSLLETQDCNTQSCILDCKVSDWTEWSECNVKCGGGTQNRTRKIIQEPKNGGIECPSLSETQECNIQPCPVNCEVSDWTEWSECNVKCGGGTQNRTRKIIQEPKNGGNDCPSLSETQNCNIQPCPINCEVSDWSEWTKCSKDCDGGVHSRSRTIIKDPNYGGETCPPLSEEQNCNTFPCINCNSEFCKNTDYKISYNNFCLKDDCIPPYKINTINDELYCKLDLNEEQRNLLNKDNNYIKRLFNIKEMLFNSSAQKESLEGSYTKSEIEDALKLPTIKKFNLFADTSSYRDFINYDNNLVRINNEGLSQLINSEQKDVPVIYDYKPIWELLKDLYFSNCLNANINENYIYKINILYRTCIGKVTDDTFKKSLIYKYQDIVANSSLPFDVYFASNDMSIDRLKDVETQYVDIEKYDIQNTNNVREEIGKLENPLYLNKITISTNFKLSNETYFGNSYNLKKIIPLIPTIEPNSFLIFESKNNYDYILIFGNYETNIEDITVDMLILDQNLNTQDLKFNLNSSLDPYVFYKFDFKENNLFLELNFSLDIPKNGKETYREYFYGRFQIFKDKIMLLNTSQEIYGNKITNKQFSINNNLTQIKKFKGSTTDGNLSLGTIKQNGKLKNIKIKGVLNSSNTIKTGTELNFKINNYNKKIIINPIDGNLQNGNIISFSNGNTNLGVVDNKIKSLSPSEDTKWIINSEKDGVINSGDIITIKTKNTGLFLYPECNKTESIDRFSKDFVITDKTNTTTTPPPNFGCNIDTDDICEKDKKCYTKCNISYLSNKNFKNSDYHSQDNCSNLCTYNNTNIVTTNVEAKWKIFKIVNGQKSEEALSIVNGDTIMLVSENSLCENNYNILVTIKNIENDNIFMSNISDKNNSNWVCNIYDEKEFNVQFTIEENIDMKKGDEITLTSNATNFEVFNLNFDVEIEPLNFLSIDNNEIIHKPKWFELNRSSLCSFVYEKKGKEDLILENNKSLYINTDELLTYFPKTGFSEFTPFPIFDISKYNIEFLGFVSTNKDNRNYDTFNKFCSKPNKRSYAGQPMRVARSPNAVFKDSEGISYYDVLYLDESDIDNPKNVIELFVPENEISIAHDACKLLQASFNLEAAYVFLNKTLCPYTTTSNNGVIQKIVSNPYINCDINTYGCWNKATGCQSDSDCSGMTKDEHLNHTEATYGRGWGWIPDVKCPDPSCPKQQGLGTGSWCDNSPTTPWDLKTCSSVIDCGEGAERCLELCYPKCRDGYHPSGCNICTRNSDSDSGEYDKVSYCTQEGNLFHEKTSSIILGNSEKLRTVKQIPDGVPKDGVGRDGQYSCAADNARVNNLNETIRSAPQIEAPCKCQNPYTIPGKSSESTNTTWNILPDRLIWSQTSDTNNYDSLKCNTKVATTDCPLSYLTDTNIGYKCYSKIWKDAGCTTEVPQNSQSNQLKDKTGKWFISDSNAWARLDDDQHRIGCYGEDRNKWPPKNYKCNMNGIRNYMFDKMRIHTGESNIDYYLIIDSTGARIEKENSDYSGGNASNVNFTNISINYSMDPDISVQILILKYNVSYNFTTLDFKTFKQITLSMSEDISIKFLDYPFYLDKNGIKIEKIPYNVICPNNFKETNISADCYKKIWKDAGCLTDRPANMDENGNGYYKDKTGQWVIDDTNFWVTDNTKNSRTLCYGNDKSKWPTIPSECPTDINNTNITYDCYNEIWSKAGCKTTPIQDINQLQDKSIKWFIDDTNSYALSTNEVLLKACYGDDRSQWPSLGYVFSITMGIPFPNQPINTTTYILKISPYLSITIGGVEYKDGIVINNVDPPKQLTIPSTGENVLVNKQIVCKVPNGKLVYQITDNNDLAQFTINGMPYLRGNNKLQKI